MRQMLADKVSGHLVGVWLLVAEELRLGTWDLLRAWTRRSTERIEPRLALQLVHEAALCTTGIRADRTLTHRGGFELAAGLPFVASDPTIHHLLAEHPVADSIALQVMLGKLRRARGDFCGKVLAVDPHRTRSYSNRHMRRHAHHAAERPTKMAQTFWLLDADTKQPVCFTTGTSSRTATHAMPSLLDIADEILGPRDAATLLLADTEHRGAELLDHVASRPGFDILVPMPHTKRLQRATSSPSRKKPSCIAGRASRPPAGPISPNAAMPGLSRSLSNAAESDPTTGATRHSCRLPKAMKSRR